MEGIEKADIEWLEGVEEIKKVSFQKGDTIVLMTEHRLSKAVYDSLSRIVKDFIIKLGFQENDLHFVILEEGMKIGVLHKESDK